MAERTQAGEFNSQIPYFLTTFLSEFDTAIPKGAQWALYFEDLPAIIDTTLKTLEEREPQNWDINALANKIGKSPILLETKGCLFAQAVEIPGESIVINPEGIQTNGFIRTAIGNGRGDYTTGIKIAFLETNFSFVDSIIRPWVITTGHLGMIARAQKYRCNIVVCKLGAVAGPVLDLKGNVVREGVGPVVTQKYTFYDACPVDVTGEEYNYSPSVGPVIRETTFVYNYYKCEQNYNIDNVPDPVTSLPPVPLDPPIRSLPVIGIGTNPPRSTNPPRRPPPVRALPISPGQPRRPPPVRALPISPGQPSGPRILPFPFFRVG